MKNNVVLSWLNRVSENVYKERGGEEWAFLEFHIAKPFSSEYAEWHDETRSTRISDRFYYCSSDRFYHLCT